MYYFASMGDMPLDTIILVAVPDRVSCADLVSRKQQRK